MICGVPRIGLSPMALCRRNETRSVASKNDKIVTDLRFGRKGRSPVSDVDDDGRSLVGETGLGRGAFLLGM